MAGDVEAGVYADDQRSLIRQALSWSCPEAREEGRTGKDSTYIVNHCRCSLS